VKVADRVGRFNEWLAVRATLVFGSMWVTYALFLYGFIPVVLPNEMNSLLYWSNTIQLWSLPLIMVGQNVMGRASVRQAAETHDAVMESLGLMREEHEAMAAMVADIHALHIPSEE
jgi:hypothetical protein